MNADSWRMARSGVWLFFLVCIQCAFANSMKIRGAQPDFVLIGIVLASMFHDGNRGAAFGFFAGIFYASFAAPPSSGFGALIISRTLTGFGVGWLEERIYRDNIGLAVVMVAVGGIAAETLFFIFAPQAHVLHWFRQMLLTTLYNAVLSPILYFPTRYIARPPSPADLL